MSNRLKANVESLQTEIEQVQSSIRRDSSDGTSSLHKIAQKQILQMLFYYGENLLEARRAFHFGLGIGIVGFLVTLIFAGAVVFRLTDVTAAVLGTIAGVVIQAFGALVLVFYRLTQKQTKEYTTQLAKTQAVLLALEEIDGIKDPAKQDAVREKVALSLVA